MRIGESRSEYVSRKVDTFKRDYQRDHELDDLPIDQGEFRLLTLETKHGAEDWYDFWDSVSPW